MSALEYVHPYVSLGTDVYFYYEPIDTVVNAAQGRILAPTSILWRRSLA
jgi:hypothetical protein